VSLPREHEHQDEDPGSRDRQLRRPDGDATRKRRWHQRLPLTEAPDHARLPVRGTFKRRGEPAFLSRGHPWQDVSFGHHRTTGAAGRQGPLRAVRVFLLLYERAGDGGVQAFGVG
jgi:hypothetical protein